MKRFMLITIVFTMFFCSSALWAYKVSFDDVPIGQNLSYYNQQYGLGMVPGWEVVDSVASGWGIPKSGTQSVVWNGNPEFGTAFGFAFEDGVSEYKASTVGAYFSTKAGVVLELRGYTANGVIIANIGESNSSWQNQYVEIKSSSLGDIYCVHIVGISSPDARYKFAMDDLTIEPVPEPSSLAALGLGVLPVAASLRLRRLRR